MEWWIMGLIVGGLDRVFEVIVMFGYGMIRDCGKEWHHEYSVWCICSVLKLMGAGVHLDSCLVLRWWS